MRRSARRGLVALVGLAALASGVGMCARVAERGRYATPYSSLGAGPDGTRGLYLAAAKLGASPLRWTRDLSGLPEGATLVALGGCGSPLRRPVRRYESEALAAWIRSGGVLVVAGAAEYLPDDLGVSLRRPQGQCRSLLPDFIEDELGEDATGPDGDAPVPDYPNDHEGVFDEPADDEWDDEEAEPLPRWARPTSPILAGLPDVPMVEPARVMVSEGVAHDVLLTIGGEAAGVLVPHGRGAVVALASATPFENEWIGESLGGVLFFRLRHARGGGGGPLVFDEYHLGVGASRSIVQYLRSLGAGPFLFQLLFAVALLLVRLGARFGRPVDEPAASPAGTEPYVDAIGALYARSGDLASVVEVARRRAVVRVARHHRVEVADAAALAVRVYERAGEAARAAIAELVTKGEPVTTRRAMVERLREIDALELAAMGEHRAKGSTNG